MKEVERMEVKRMIQDLMEKEEFYAFYGYVEGLLYGEEREKPQDLQALMDKVVETLEKEVSHDS